MRFFGHGRVYIWCAVSWLIGTMIAAPAFHPCCKQLFIENFTTWQWTLDTWGGNMMSYFDMAATGTVSEEICPKQMRIPSQAAAIMAFFNLRVLLEIHHQHKSTTTLAAPEHIRRKRAREQHLFVQFFIVGAVLIVYDLMFNILPRLDDR